MVFAAATFARWLAAPIELGKPTLATVTGLSAPLLGVVFGTATITLALALPAVRRAAPRLEVRHGAA